jgi:hypothetical protein
VSALQQLAQLEYRAPKAQAALIIRKELVRLGLVPPELNEETENKKTAAKDGHASCEEDQHASTIP